jgi:hypothetical protein
MRLKKIAVLAATVAVAVAGCGDDDTGSPAATDAEPAEQGAAASGTALSPDARAAVERGQRLAADVFQTATAYAGGDLTDEQALRRLETQQDRADALQADARALPETDAAARRIVGLSDAIRRSLAQVVRNAERSGDRQAAGDAADELRAAAQSTFSDLRGRLPQNVREDVDRALSELRG